MPVSQRMKALLKDGAMLPRGQSFQFATPFSRVLRRLWPTVATLTYDANGIETQEIDNGNMVNWTTSSTATVCK
jgi:hypothetical protein